VGLVAIAALAASLVIGGGEHRTSPHHQTVASTPATVPAPPLLPPLPPGDPTRLAADFDLAQRIIDDRASPTPQLASAGRFQQLAIIELARQRPRVRRSVLARLDAPTAASTRSDLEAAAVLTHLVTPQRSLPPWRIVAPPAPSVLLGYFRAAQARFGVPWQYLAAIEFVETKFGRVRGPSSAGAQGPMQFLPATWARYGHGDIHNPRDSILGAARYLVANGAPGDMTDALYHYNPSIDYVRAVSAYAERMRADRRAYYGYYYWQVIYAHVGGLLILPVGYPKARPERL